MAPVFLSGPLAAPDMLRLLNGGRAVVCTAADLPRHDVYVDRGLPVLAAAATTCPGVLVAEPSAALLGALDRYDAASGQTPARIEVVLDGRLVAARVGLASLQGAPRWSGADGPEGLLREMLDEILRSDLTPEDLARARPGLLRRAIGRRAGRAGGPRQALGTSIEMPRLRGLTLSRCHGGFFVTEGLRFSHRLIGGGWSGEVDREVFVTGDAVSVLPWDPATRQLLLIRQIRAGMVVRQDPDPWNLEAVAGLVDREEDGPETARREAREEAGLVLGEVTLLAEYYTSPGTMTEFVRSYVAITDLSAYRPGIHGLEAENEDIETLLVSEDEAAAALDRGEVRNAPLMISLYAFFRRRAELVAARGLPLAGPGGGT